MEVIGGVASVIAIVDLAGKIAKICAGYIGEVREYEAEVKALTGRVQCLQKVLQQLDDLLKGPHQGKLTSSTELQDNLIACKGELQSLENRIEKVPPAPAAAAGPSNNRLKKPRKFFDSLKKAVKGETLSSVGRVLIWPIEKADVNKVISRLEGIESAIQFALQVDQTKVILDVDVKINLVNLPVAEGASFNWYGDDHEPKCLPNTREELLKKIDNWVNGSSGKHIFWLSGAAGTGKSTIARTVAETYTQARLLGASFFFRRGAGDRSNASRFFTTLATNLMQHIPDIRLAISKTIEKEPDITRKILKEQFDKLIFEPLSLTKHPERTILVIDALDECDDDRDVLTIVKLLGLLKNLNGVDIRIFITSRREVFINAGFQRISGDFQDLILHDIEEQKILHDIMIFLNHELGRIKTDHVYCDTLPPDWPNQITIETLAKMACPLFIVASTICRFIGDSESLPGDLLMEILEGRQKLIEANPEKSLSLVYLQIIKQRVKNKTPTQISIMRREFQDIIGTIVLLQTPLPQNSLLQLIDIGESKAQARLDGFQSVINLPANPDGVIKTFHLSFREFLLDSQTKEQSPLWIDEYRVHRFIAKRCIAIMKKHLRKNICDLPSPDYIQKDISASIIKKFFPQELQYACRYWVYHIIESHEGVCDGGEAHLFLQDYILEWLEATSILQICIYNIDAIVTLESAISKECGDRVRTLLYDIRRFIRFNYEIIAQLPLQTYHSALLFSPENCLLRQKFSSSHLDWILNGPQVPKDWGRLLQTIDVGDRLDGAQLISMEFISNGQKLVAYFKSYTRNFDKIFDRLVETWDLKTGALLKTEYCSSESLPVYSPDTTWSASVLEDDSILISDLLTGLEVKKIPTTANCNSQKPLAFSNDRKYFLSAIAPQGGGNTLLLWETMSWNLLDSWDSGQASGTLYGAFSRDGSSMVTWTQYRGLDPPVGPSIRFWDAESRNILQCIEKGFAMLKLAFSPNGEYLAHICDETVYVFRLHQRKLEQIIVFSSPELDGGSYSRVAFASNEEIAITFGGRTSVWCPYTGKCIRICRHRDNSIKGLAFSPACRTFATYESQLVSKINLWDSPWPEELFAGLEEEDKGNYPGQTDFINISYNCDFAASVAGALGEFNLWQIHPDGLMPCSQTLLTYKYDESQYIWSLFGREISGTFSRNSKFFAAVNFHLPETLTIVSTDTGDVVYEDLVSGRGLWLQKDHCLEPSPGLLAFSPNERFLVFTLRSNAMVLVLDLESHNRLITLRSDNLTSCNGNFEYVIFSTRGNILALVSSFSCELWCTERWEAINCEEYSKKTESTESSRATKPTDSFKLIPGSLRFSTSKNWIYKYSSNEGILREENFDLHDASGRDGSPGAGPVAWRDGWVAQNGVRSLWVPPAYRGNDPKCSRIQGNRITFAIADRVDTWKFKHPIW
ncbi:hypothetical protein TWF225_002409 [Orbilia oligospora]|nr:hypothetical protein TWF225_002409 [Orbilia oligospora]KAF3251931.1 hypothetical protein TWF217_007915 [Orbilia oligospora]KAF3257028.1 hypothetical protein TWF128_005165 [Orbilia oligospora]